MSQNHAQHPSHELGHIPAGQFSYNTSVYQPPSGSGPMPPAPYYPQGNGDNSKGQPPIVMQPTSSHNPPQYPYDDQRQVIDQQPPGKRSQMPVQVQHGMANPGYGETSFSVAHPQTYVMTNVPRGLEYLAGLDRVFIRQKIELLEVILGCETKNKYQIFDFMGREIFNAKEDTDFCTRYCCGPIRPFDMLIKDPNGEEIIHLTRPLACGTCCFPCCLQSIDVYAPPGNFVGRVDQEWSLWIPHYNVKNAAGETVLHIKGPCCTVSCCMDVEFQVLSPDRAVEVGRISKKWSGLAREFFTDADNFGLSFPMDLDVKMKAVMIGACMLIDFMFFEQNKNNN